MVSRAVLARDFEAAHVAAGSALQTIDSGFNLASAAEVHEVFVGQVQQSAINYRSFFRELQSTPGDIATLQLVSTTLQIAEEDAFGRLQDKSLGAYGSEQAPYSIPLASRLMIELVARHAEEAVQQQIRDARNINLSYLCAGMAIGHAWATEALAIAGKTDSLRHSEATLSVDTLKQNTDLFKLPMLGEAQASVDAIEERLVSTTEQLAVPAVERAADILVAQTGSVFISPSVQGMLPQPTSIDDFQYHMDGASYFTLGIKPGAVLLLNAVIAEQAT